MANKCLFCKNIGHLKKDCVNPQTLERRNKILQYIDFAHSHVITRYNAGDRFFGGYGTHLTQTLKRILKSNFTILDFKILHQYFKGLFVNRVLEHFPNTKDAMENALIRIIIYYNTHILHISFVTQPTPQPPPPPPQISPPQVKISIFKANKTCVEIECAVCYEQINNDNFVYLNCNHEFCKTCIKTLITKTNCPNICPLCRCDIRQIYTVRPKISYSL